MKSMIYIARVSLVVSFLLSSVAVFAQNRITVTGQVKDESGVPVIGAAVMVEGGSAGVITDMDGKYSITFTPTTKRTPALVFSSLSYETQTIPVSASGIVDVVLKEDSEQLEEVVVVGYGEMRKSDITGSVTSVRIDEAKAGHSTSLDQLLQGQAAGVQVVSNSGAPDSGVSVLIRGASSFNSSSQPLYVVDGVIMDTAGSVSMGTHGGNESGVVEDNNGLIGLNPQDIASMEILKDASATAIYGSQGANGVVLITTKSASQSKPSVSFTAGVSIVNVTKKYELMDADDYMKYLDMKGVSHNDAQYTVYTKSVENGTYTPVDRQDYTMRAGISQRYYLSVSGKPKTLDYRLSIGYTDNQGVIKNTGFENAYARVNLNKTLGRFQFSSKTSFSWLDSHLTQGAGGTIQQTPATSLIMSMLMTRPLRMTVATDAEGSEVNDDSSPLSGPDRWLNDYDSRREEFRVISSISGKIRIFKWLTFTSRFGFDYRTNERSMFKSQRINTQGTGSNGSVTHQDRLSWNWNNHFGFNKKFKRKHTISGSVGQTASQYRSRNQTVEGTNIKQWKAMASSLNSAPYAWLTYGEGHTQLLSFFSRFNYNYCDRYLVTATYRADGSSKFAGKNKWAHFPSFALAWRINNEPWFKKVRFAMPWFTSAKLRLGWGMVGNQGIPSNQTRYSYSAGTVATHDNVSHTLTSISSNNLPSPDLKWETTTQYNLGLDLEFFKGRLVLAADGYYKLTEDLLQEKIITASVGVDNPYVNMGSISNTGFELSLSAVPISKRNVEWTIDGNFTLNRNKVVSINPSGAGLAWKYVYPNDRQPRKVQYFIGEKLSSSSVNADYLNIFIVGEPMSLFYALPTDGIVQEGQKGVPFPDGKERGPGSINFVDTNGDKVISAEDKVVVGNPNPDFTYGFSTSFRFKGFRLSASFVGSYGNDIYNQQLANLCDMSTTTANRLRAPVFDCWSPQNTGSMWPSIAAYRSNDHILCSDRYVEDGSYLRLSNASLSYTFSLRDKKILLRHLTLSVSCKNLFCLTKYSGYDPDVNIYGKVLKYGIDMGGYPAGRTFMFDVKLNF